MKNYLGNAGMIVILLLFGLSSADAKYITIYPNHINISGIYQAGSFSSDLAITALDNNIKELNLSPDPLISASVDNRSTRIIKADSIKIAPNNISIEKGRIEAFTLHVQNITEPDRYSGKDQYFGKLFLKYLVEVFNSKENRSEDIPLSENIPIVVDVYRPDKLLDVKPSRVSVSGIIGTSSLQNVFCITAPYKDILDLTFSPGNFTEVNKKSLSLGPKSIRVSSLTNNSIGKGKRETFVVMAKDINFSGEYNGTINIYYKGQSPDSQAALPVTIRALKFNAPSATPTFRFEKGFWKIPGSGEQKQSVPLKEFSGQCSESFIINEVCKKAHGEVEPLVNATKKSLFLSSDGLMDKNDNIKISPIGQGIRLNITFSNPYFKYPQVDAGEYQGKIDISSEEFGNIISVPVVVQIRYPWFLAAFTVFFGVAMAFFLQWWNAVGKKRNALDGSLRRLRHRLADSSITTVCRRDIENKIFEAESNNRIDKIDVATQLIVDADKLLTDCIEKKKKLEKALGDIGGLRKDFSKIRNNIIDIAKGFDVDAEETPVIKKYLQDVDKDLIDLGKDIDRESYADTEGELMQKLKDFESQKDLFNAEDGFIKSLRDFRKKYQEASDEAKKANETIIADIKIIKSLKIESKDDIKGFKAKLDDATETLNKAKKVEPLASSVKNRAEFMSKFMNAINSPATNREVFQMLSSQLRDPALQKSFGHIIDPYITPASPLLSSTPPGGQPPRIIDLVAKPERSQKINNEISFQANAEDTENDAIEYSFYIRERRKDEEEVEGQITEEEKTDPNWRLMRDWSNYRTLTWTPNRSGKYFIRVGAKDKDNQGSSYKIPFTVEDKGYREKLGELLVDWFPPDFRAVIVSYSVGISAVAVLGWFGYSELYDKNPTFGFENPSNEYLLLFLWGFGIQSATGVVAGVKKEFLGLPP